MVFDEDWFAIPFVMMTCQVKVAMNVYSIKFTLGDNSFEQ